MKVTVDAYLKELDRDLLRSEMDHADDALLMSDQQCREFVRSVDRARRGEANGGVEAGDLCKLMHAALALNEHLRKHAEKLHALRRERDFEAKSEGMNAVERIRLASQFASGSAGGSK